MTTTHKFCTALLIMIIGMLSSVRAANNCTASTVLGASCSTSCESGWHGECSGGVFVADCKCVKDGSQGFHHRILPPIIIQQINDCLLFEQWAQSSDSPGLQQLAPLATNSRIAVQSQNIVAFNNAEDQFSTAWTGLSLPDQQAVTQWRAQHGYIN